MKVEPQHTYTSQSVTASREASSNLSTATPSEAAHYALNYVKAHIRDSVNLEMLNGTCPQEIKAQQRDMHNRAGVYSTPVDCYTTNDFINLTREAERCSIGNCADVCMVAARSLTENGYPYPVELCTIQGDVKGYKLDHAFLRIHCDPKNRDIENHIIDPLLQMLSQPKQHDLFGRTLQTSCEEPDFRKHFYCYATEIETGKAKFLPVSDINNMNVLSCAKISLDPYNKSQFVPTSK